MVGVKVGERRCKGMGGESGSRGKAIEERKGGEGRRERKGEEGTSLQQEVHRACTTKLKSMRCPPITREGNDTVCLLSPL